MIKISTRRNLIYLVYLIIFYHIRIIEKTIIEHFYPFNDSLIFTLLMHLGELLGGLITFIYQKTFINRRKKKRRL